MAKIQKRAKPERPNLGEMIRGLPKVVTPVQEVRPVATKNVAEEQVKINGFFVSPDLAKRLKLHAVNNDMTQREILIEALEKYLA